MEAKYRYYRGEKECPQQLIGTDGEKFWRGEMMFATTGVDINEWVKLAEEAKKELPEEKLAIANRYSIEEFAMLIYIGTQYSSHNPYADMSWTYHY